MSDKVTLNIGGTRFETTQQTLSSVPNNYFSSQLSDRWALGDRSELFIDRDPTHFRRILNYLRSRTVPVGLRRGEWAELQIEADFYCVPGIVPSVDTLDEDYEEFGEGDQVRLKPSTIEEYGHVLGREPVDVCYSCRDQIDCIDVFGKEFCSFCHTKCSELWKCVQQTFMQNHISKVGNFELKQLETKHAKYMATKAVYTVENVFDHCLVIRRTIPSGNPQLPPIHIPKEFVKKIM